MEPGHAMNSPLDSLRTISCANGRSIQVCRLRGTVIYADRKRTTHVRNQSGYGIIGHRGGFLAAPTMTADTQEEQAIYAEMDGVGDISFNFQNWDIPVQEGDRIAVLIATVGSETDQILAVCSLTSKVERWLPVRSWAQERRLLSFEAETAARSIALIGGEVDAWRAGLLAFATACPLAWLFQRSACAPDPEPRRIEKQLSEQLHGLNEAQTCEHTIKSDADPAGGGIAAQTLNRGASD